jgi:hypothetical protein
MSRRAAVIVVVLLALAGLLAWRLRPRPSAPPPLRPARPLAQLRALAAHPPRRANPNPPAPPGPGREDAPSELVNGLNSPSTDIDADLRLLNDLFMHYRSAIHGLDPIGENVDITEVLTGRNALGYAFVPKDCPAINADGELCDRWGTPFIFHQLSGEEMEIRSAGPDRKYYTADDEVLTP